MNSQNKRYIIAGAIGILVILLIATILYKNRGEGVPVTPQNTDIQEFSTSSPVEIVLDFYEPWLKAQKSTSTDPITLEPEKNMILSKELRTRLSDMKNHAPTEIDPILCQTTTPERVTGRIVSQDENEVRVLVMAKDTALTAQSVFTLKKMSGGWYIDSILCSPGEFDVPREFSFDQEGYLLKRVPPPLDSNFWHIVFEQDGEQGHAVPLLFDADSMCTALDGTKTTCNADVFTEAMKIHVYAQMIEAGAQVKRLEFAK